MWHEAQSLMDFAQQLGLNARRRRKFWHFIYSFDSFGALFRQAGNKFCMLHPLHPRPWHTYEKCIFFPYPKKIFLVWACSPKQRVGYRPIRFACKIFSLIKAISFMPTIYILLLSTHIKKLLYLYDNEVVQFDGCASKESRIWRYLNPEVYWTARRRRKFWKFFVSLFYLDHFSSNLSLVQVI